MRKVYYVRIPKKLVEVYRVVATSEAQAIKLVGISGEQQSNEDEMDTGPARVDASDEQLNEWD